MIQFAGTDIRTKSISVNAKQLQVTRGNNVKTVRLPELTNNILELLKFKQNLLKRYCLIHRIHKWWTARLSLGREHENEVGKARNGDTAETSTVPVLLKESNIPEASIAGRKPVELENDYLLVWLE